MTALPPFPGRCKKDDNAWSALLERDPAVLASRKGATDSAYTGAYISHAEPDGVYCCACCQNPLFTSAMKLNKQSGGCAAWPGFCDCIPQRVGEIVPSAADGAASAAKKHSEVVCVECEAHLGHLFRRGAASSTAAGTGASAAAFAASMEPAQRRFCINSTIVRFVPNVTAEEALRNFELILQAANAAAHVCESAASPTNEVDEEQDETE